MIANFLTKNRIDKSPEAMQVELDTPKIRSILMERNCSAILPEKTDCAGLQDLESA